MIHGAASRARENDGFKNRFKNKEGDDDGTK